MARLSLNCACGWNFFIAGTVQSSEVACPSCGEPVRIPGRKPGQGPMAPGLIAARKQSQAKMITILVGALALVIVGGIVFVLNLGGNGAPPDGPSQPAPYAPDSYGETRAPARAIPQPAGGPNPNAPKTTAVRTEVAIADLKHTLYQRVFLINMTGLVSEAVRLRGLTSSYESFQTQMVDHEKRILSVLAELEAQAVKPPMELYLRAGDRIVAFAGKNLTQMRPLDAAAHLQTWLEKFRAGALEECGISRGETALTVYLNFPEESKELLQMTRHPALSLEPSPAAVSANAAAPQPPSPAASTTVGPLPQEYFTAISSGFEALPAGYREYLTHDDRKRLDDLAAKTKGSAEDAEFLKNRILGEALPRFQQEAAFVRAKVLELEPKLKEGAASDVVHFKDGRKVEGQVLEETEAHIKIKSRFGAVSVPKADVLRVERGKGAGLEFPERLKAAGDKLEALHALLAWCKDKNLRLEKEYLAYLILTRSATSEKARAEVGLARPGIRPSDPAPKGPVSKETEAARNEAALKAIEIIAAEVAKKHTHFTEVVTEMKRQTESYHYSAMVLPPEKSARGAALIPNPLTFRPNEMPVATALEIGNWWGTLSPDDRREFAKFYGTWCAYTRSAAQKR